MTTFEERERGFEAHFALDEQLEFKAHARRDRAVALWAAERMGLSGEAQEAYAKAVVHADMQGHGDESVFEKVMADLAEHKVECLPHELRARMDEFLAVARAELKASG